jgi:2'-5' RNA ligase
MRTFVALAVKDGPAARELVACRDALAASRADVKWVAANQFHVTLRFLGEVSEADCEAVKAATETAAASLAGPLEVTLRDAGCFTRQGRPSAIWMRMTDSGGMAALERALSAELERAGFPPERKPFQAHVTLGRARSSVGTAALLSAIERWNARGPDVPHRFETLTLFESRLTPKGPIYTPLLEARLGARADQGRDGRG